MGSLRRTVMGAAMEARPARTPRYGFSGAFAACVAVIVFGASNLGVNCGPQPVSNGECGCTPPEETICAACVSPRQQGQSCTDECGAHPCAPGLLCFQGTCVPGGGPGAACFLGVPCSTDFYCRGQTCPFSIHDGFDHCSAYQGQGDSCISPGINNGCAQPDTLCRQCEPGTQCTSGACASPCADDSDCFFCGPFSTCLQVTSQIPAQGGNVPYCGGTIDTTDHCAAQSGCSNASGGFCYACSSLGAQCDFGHPCCGVGQACPVDAQTGNGKCCIPPANNPGIVKCSTTADCCSPAVCETSIGVCCLATGGQCATDGQCCAGLTCQSGKCAKPKPPPPVCAGTCAPCQTHTQCCDASESCSPKPNSPPGVFVCTPSCVPQCKGC